MLKRIVSEGMLVLLLAGILTFTFNIYPVRASDIIHIRADGSIDPPTAPIYSTDNITYTLTGDITGRIIVERDNIVVDGGGYAVEGDNPSPGFYGAIDLSGRSNVTIRNSEIATGANVNFGIFIHDSSTNNNIYDNSFEGYTAIGVWYGSADNVISGNTIDCSFGVDVEWSSSNTISGNEMTCGGCGVGLLDSSFNTVFGNNITVIAPEGVANWGVYLDSSSHNLIAENKISLANEYGIFIYWSSNDNTISGNNIIDNDCGVHLYQSSDNKIYHNNFINNTIQAFSSPVNIQYSNIWDDDYPSGGNYWSDYSGNDLYSGPYQNEPGSDGIGDTSYNINLYNKDRYPLMKPVPDSAVTRVTRHKTVVGQGYNVSINVTLTNQGMSTETFNVTVYANTTVINTFTNITLTSGNHTTLTFSWNTTDYAKGNYTINSYVTPIPFEVDTADNNFTDGWVLVTIAGDVTSDTLGVPDGIVNMRDIGAICDKFMTTPSDPEWNPNRDINGDGVVNMRDIGIACNNFMKT